MPKYVCDYEEVASDGEKIVEIANDYATDASKYDANIKQDLEKWRGEAKGAFNYQSEGAIKEVASKIIRMAEFGEFVKEVPKQIQELEDKLAAEKI